MILSKIEQFDAFRWGVADQIMGRPGEQDLAAIGNGPQPSAAVHGRAKVVSGAQFGFPRVNRHPDAKRRFRGPSLDSKRLLDFAGGRDRVVGSAKDSKEAVALTSTADNGASVLLDPFGEQRVMTGDCQAHGLRQSLPQSGASLDVGQ